MKNSYKAAIVAALAMATVSAANAAGSYTANDLLVGFTTQSGNDLIYDLGSESSVLNGTASYAGLDSLLTSTYGSSLSGVSWGVIGNGVNSGTVRTAYTTTVQGVVPNTYIGSTAFSKLNNAAGTLANNNFTSASVAGDSATVAASLAYSWNTETLNGTLTSDYVNAYENPNVTGATSADFSQVNNDGSDPTLLGDFSLGSNGTSDALTFNPVPEPTTLGLLGGAGVLLLAFRNKLGRKQA
jgi:hypothetical protein